MRSLGSSVGIVLSLMTPLGSVAASAADPLPRSILVLEHTDLGGPFYHSVFSGLRSTVNASSAAPITIYVENLDLIRFASRDYEQSLRSHLRVKYRDKPIGVLV